MTAANNGEQASGSTRFGPFSLIRVLGEGAMGRVWLAREDHPPRDVALKLLHNPLLRSDFLERFQREVRLLGRLEHPNIARLYRAGEIEADNGLIPYLALEYIRGEALLAYAQSHGLDLSARLRLLAQIARAVHHAHTRGIVHRDLKPANILVDDLGEPKVLDFGVAQLITGEDATQVTVTGEIVGTVAYMAPEQFGLDPGAIDPRSDVYALGVIGYELITGELPYPDLRGSSLVNAVAAVRHGEARRLGRLHPESRGDVETIVMKALARDPEQRYASAAELAADIERWLHRQPITARPPSASYLLRLFVQRHRAVAAAAALAALSLVGATLISARFALSESAARTAAETRLHEREAVSGFLQDMLTAADPQRALGERLTVLDVLDIARVQLEEPGSLPPGAATQLHRTLGNTYSSLGRGADAVHQLEQALIRLPPDAGADSRLRLELDHTAALASAGREAEALELTQELLASMPPDATDPEVLHAARLQLASLLDQRGHVEAAEAELRALIPEPSSDTPNLQDATAMARLGLNLNRQGRYEESLDLAQRAAASMAVHLGTRHPRTLEAEEAAAVSLRDMARYDEAAAVVRRTLAVRIEILGKQHPLTQQSRAALAAVLAYNNQVEEAWPLVQEAYSALLTTLGPDAETVRILGNLYAHVASQRGDHAEAIRVLSLIVAQNDAMPGGPSATDLADYNNLAYNLMHSDQCREALIVQERLITLAQDLLGDDHLHTALFRVNQASCLERQGQPEAAHQALILAVPVLEAGLGEAHPRSASARQRLDAYAGR